MEIFGVHSISLKRNVIDNLERATSLLLIVGYFVILRLSFEELRFRESVTLKPPKTDTINHMKYIYSTIAILLLLVSCKPKGTKLAYDLKISNVSIIDENGALSSNKNVYLSNDSIYKIEEVSTLSDDKDGNIIDGSGKFLLLGFWDNHTHFRGGEALIPQNEKFLEQFIKYGITTVRDAGGDLTTQVQQWNEEIKNKKRMGPTIYTSGPKLDGKNARWAGSIGVNTDDEISKALDSLQQLGVDYVKLYDSTIARDTYLSIITQAEERGMITSGHMPFTVTLDETIAAGIDNIEHLYYILKGCSSREKEITQDIKDGKLGFWGSMEQLIASYDEEAAQSTFEKLKSNNVYVTPTLYIGDVLSYMDEVNHSDDAYLKTLDADFIATYEGRNKGALNASPKAKQDRKELQQFFLNLVASLDKAGVNLLSGSDSGAFNSYTYPGPSLHGELEEMVRAGISPANAIATMYQGANFLHKKGYHLAAGNKADLVLLNSNPLLDISATQDIHLVIKNGTIVHTEK